MNRSRVLVVIGQLDVGGAERHLVRVMPRLHGASLEVLVYTLRGGGAWASVLQAAGVRVLCPPRRRRGVLGLAQTALHLAGVLRRERPHILHFFLPEAYLLGSLCAFVVPDCVRVMSRRGLGTYQRRYPGMRWFEPWLHRRTAVILGNSRAVVEELCREGVPGESLGLIYNGIEVNTLCLPHDRAALRTRLRLRFDDLVIVVVANLIPY